MNINGALELGGASGTAQFATLTGAGNLTIDSGITANFTEANTAWTASNITIDGTANISASNAMPNGSYKIGNSGKLNLNGNFLSIGSLNGSGTISLSSTSAGGILQTNGNGVYSGVIQNGSNALPGSIDVLGLTLTLSGNNTYSGGTTIGSAVLEISDPSNLGSPDGSVYFLTFSGSAATLRPLQEFTLAPSPSLGIELLGGGQYRYDKRVSRNCLSNHRLSRRIC